MFFLIIIIILKILFKLGNLKQKKTKIFLKIKQTLIFFKRKKSNHILFSN
jgi:hypothetical protein